MEPGTTFQPVLDDPRAPHDTAERILLVSGKLYYDLAANLPADLASKVAIIRVEELAPFPFATLSSVLAKYKNVKLGEEGAVTWVQEEPKNQGAWTHVAPRLREVVGRDVRFWGRKEDAVPAPGTGKVYKREQEEVVKGIFGALGL